MAPQNKLLSASVVALVVSAVARGAPTCSSVGPNLLGNPGFEASSASINPWNLGEGTAGKVVSPGEGSKRALDVALKNTPNGGQPSFFQDVSPACPGDHLFAFDFRTEHQGPQAGLVVAALGGNSGTELVKQSNTTWTRFEEYYPNTGLPGSDVASFQLFPLQHAAMDNGIVFDNALLVAAGKVAIKSGATERVTNGGFETGKLAPFRAASPSENVTVVSPGLGGSKHALLVGSPAAMPLVEVNVTLTPGSHYELSLAYSYSEKTTPEAYASIGLSTQEVGGANTLGGSVGSYLGFTDLHQGAGTFSRRFVAHGKVTTLSLSFASGSATSSVTIDNVSVKEVVKPTGA